MEHAEKLAEYSKNYKLLVQIKIENRRDNYGALDIIDKKIRNIKEKVTCLQLYVPKLLKLRGDNKEAIGELRDNQQRILKIVQDIASALCEWIKLNKRGFETPEFKQQYELKPHQKVRIEDLLQIFVDDLALSKTFLSFVVDDLGPRFPD